LRAEDPVPAEGPVTEQAARSVPAGAPPRPPEAPPAADGPVEEAIRRFQAGTDREGAFRVLYETYFHPLQRFFARKGLAAEECLDLTQETFLGIYRGLKGYEHRQRFAAWLYQVATTVFLKRLRRAATAKRSAVEVSRDGMETPEATLAVPGRQLDELLDQERRRALRAAVADLPEQMRDCLTLRLYHQLAYHEIATVKRISVETVKAHLFRARKKLQERLAGLVLEGLEEE
jgi:RNA polymerase sigma-70 factor (ECF subfamily)